MEKSFTFVLAALAVAAAGLWLTRPQRLVALEFARQRRRAGARVRRAQLPAGEVAYLCSGSASGTPVLHVHGYTGMKENWLPLMAALGRELRQFAPDLPGWGESERRSDAVYGFPEQAARVSAFVAALSPEAPVILLGHSMGGGIAAVAAARFPQQVARLGLLNAAGVRFADNQFGLDVLDGKNPFAVEDAATLRRFIDTVFFDPAAKPSIPWPVSSAMIQRRHADADFEQAVLDRIGRSDENLLPGEEAVGIQQPTLLVWGRQDAVIDPSALEIYAQRIPQARKLLLDGCGHMSLMERADAVAAAVIALVESNPEAG